MGKINKFFGIGATLAILIIGFIFGRMEFIKSTVAVQSPAVSNDERWGDKNDKWSFINPLLDCGDLSNLSNKTVSDLKDKIIDLINDQKKVGIDHSAVYFRDLNNGPWFGINEKEQFLAASLLKVPLMLSLLKQAMYEPDLLNRQFVWQGDSRNSSEYFKAKKELEKNHTYSIDEALTYMIKYSDNNSSNVLNYAISTDTLLSSFEDLGIASPDQQDYSISARTYASFFRILYNSTFLSKEYSEKALRLLSETQFNKGLALGVPSSIKISHKFGERRISAVTKQLHDCGIVYYPGRPYLLCVMTRSNDGDDGFDRMASFIAQVSKMVYTTVDKEKE